MRAKEFVVEQERDVSGEDYHGLPFPSAQTITGADRSYQMYRHGIAMARAPEQNKTITPSGPVANNYWLIPYSKEEQDIINKANNIMGFSSKFISNKGKKEEDGGNAISPLPQNSGKKIRKGS